MENKETNQSTELKPNSLENISGGKIRFRDIRDIPMTEAEFHYDGDYILDRTLQLIADGTYLEIPEGEAGLRRKALIFAPVAMGAVALLFLFFRIRRKQRNSTCSPN